MWLAGHFDASLQTVLQCTTPLYSLSHLHCNTSTKVACCNLLIVLRIVCCTAFGSPFKCTLLVALLQPTSYHRKPAETVQIAEMILCLAVLATSHNVFEQATHPSACL